MALNLKLMINFLYSVIYEIHTNCSAADWSERDQQNSTNCNLQIQLSQTSGWLCSIRAVGPVRSCLWGKWNSKTYILITIIRLTCRNHKKLDIHYYKIIVLSSFCYRTISRPKANDFTSSQWQSPCSNCNLLITASKSTESKIRFGLWRLLVTLNKFIISLSWTGTNFRSLPYCWLRDLCNSVAFCRIILIFDSIRPQV